MENIIRNLFNIEGLRFTQFNNNENHLKTRKSFWFTVLVFVLLGTSIFAQEKNIPKYQFNSLNNIPTQRAVASISQDQQGFIWMGTNGLGLNKYNGLDYSSYQYNEKDTTSLSSSFIYITYVDSQNRLWVGTEAGLDLYNRDRDNFIHIDLTGKKTRSEERRVGKECRARWYV